MSDDTQIKHPRRILLVGSPDSGFARPLKELTGSAPQPDTSGSFAGVTHEWSIKNAYYNATIPIWIDELTDIEQWRSDFLIDEAKEVIQAVGAWIYCFKRAKNGNEAQPAELDKSIEDVMKAIEEVVENACPGWDGTRLALDMSSQQPETHREVIEEQCMDHGFEYVHVDAKGKNEFGEATGLDRVKEALEANDWSAQGLVDETQEDIIGGFDAEEAQMNAELWGLKASLLDQNEDDAQGEDGALQVEGLEQMMSQLLAIRETSAGMPEDERKRFAARAINDLMKDL